MTKAEKIASEKLKVVISSPSLDERENVSGIAGVVRSINFGLRLCESTVSVKTHLIGRKDSDQNLLFWILKQISVPILFAFEILTSRPNIVHINGPLDKLAIVRDLVLMKIASFFGYPVLLHIHGGPFVHSHPHSKTLVKAIRHMFSIANGIVVLGKIESEKIQNLYLADPEKIYVMPNAVPVPQIMPIRKTHKEDRLNILFMGRLVEQKGIKVLITSLLDLKKNNTAFKVFFYGAGPLQAEIIDSLSHLGGAFYFGGIANGADKLQIFSNVDVLVLPSLYGEGLPMVILEAMAAGVIVVATPDGSIPEVIHHGYNGFLVPKGDRQALSYLLQNLATMKLGGHLHNIEKNAFDMASNEYDVIPYIRKLLELYKILS